MQSSSRYVNGSASSDNCLGANMLRTPADCLLHRHRSAFVTERGNSKSIMLVHGPARFRLLRASRGFDFEATRSNQAPTRNFVINFQVSPTNTSPAWTEEEPRTNALREASLSIKCSQLQSSMCWCQWCSTSSGATASSSKMSLYRRWRCVRQRLRRVAGTSM